MVYYRQNKSIKTRKIMKQSIKCKLGMHNYEIIDTKEVNSYHNTVIGLVYISRCKNCGKIKSTRVYTDNIIR